MNKLIHIIRYNFDESYKKNFDKKLYKSRFSMSYNEIREGLK